MLIKTAQATDYSGVSNIPLNQAPVPAVEFIQKTNIMDFTPSASTEGPLSPFLTFPTIVQIDLPSWANFSRYKKIQFSFGSFTSGGGDIVGLLLRKNNQTYNTSTKYYQTQLVTGTTSISFTGTSVTSGLIPSQGSFNTTASVYYNRHLDVYLTQTGGLMETAIGNHNGSLSYTVAMTNFSFSNIVSSSYLPGYLDSDSPGVTLQFSSGSTFYPPQGGAASRLVDYKFDCSVYGWLR